MRNAGIMWVSFCVFWCVLPIDRTMADPFPYELETGHEAAVLGSAALLFGGGWFAERGFRPLTAAEIADHDPGRLSALDRAATRRWSPRADKASDILLYTTLTAPLSLAVVDRGAKEPGTVGLMYAETMLLQGGAVYLLKNLVSRSRPFVYNDDPAVPLELKMSRTARRSFPSGHAASSFASMVFTAGVFERLYPDSSARGWVWGGCLAAAGTTTYLRYAAGRHFLTDLVAGAVLGATAGWLVPKWHEIDPHDPLRDPSLKSVPGVTFSVRLGF